MAIDHGFFNELGFLGGIEDIVKQNLLAIAWLWHYGAPYGANPDRLYVAGHSAGGHLAAMLLACTATAVRAQDSHLARNLAATCANWRAPSGN